MALFRRINMSESTDTVNEVIVISQWTDQWLRAAAPWGQRSSESMSRTVMCGWRSEDRLEQRQFLRVRLEGDTRGRLEKDVWESLRASSLGPTCLGEKSSLLLSYRNHRSTGSRTHICLVWSLAGIKSESSSSEKHRSRWENNTKLHAITFRR